jgi:hypothetical protein
MMKKTTVLALALAMLTASACSRPAEAAIGIATIGTPAGIPLVVAGGAVSAFGVLDILFVASGCILGCGDPVRAWLQAIGITLGGLLLLDEDPAASLRFQTMNADEGAKLGLTEGELDDYNSYLDEVNAVSQDVARELRRSENPGFEQASAAWQKRRLLIPTEAAFSAVAKVSSQWLSQGATR